MKTVEINELKYEIIKDYRDGFDLEEVKNKLTDYFYDYDYVVGDWAYGKLRLKGFYETNNRKTKPLNDISLLDNYLEDNCAKNCRHFVLKKLIDKQIKM